MHNQAAAAYQKTTQSTATGRELEATLLMKAAAQLQISLDDWVDDRPETLHDALTYNRRLWTILTTSVVDTENPLPDEVKENLGSLGAFVLKQTIDLLLTPEKTKVKTLVTINRNIAQGLRGA